MPLNFGHAMLILIALDCRVCLVSDVPQFISQLVVFVVFAMEGADANVSLVQEFPLYFASELQHNPEPGWNLHLSHFSRINVLQGFICP